MNHADLTDLIVSDRDPTLHDLLNKLNAARSADENSEWKTTAETFFHTRYQANHRLAVYGSLAPGRANHRVVEALQGNWHSGTVRGRIYSSGWGAGARFPGICLDQGGGDINISMLTTDTLASEWGRLDAFEGDEYLRLLAVVSQSSSQFTIANIYSLRCDPETI